MLKNAMDMDGKIADYIPIKSADAKKFPDLFGIEVELEGANVQTVADKMSPYWAAHHDHSLRAHNGGQAIEYVFHHPYDITKTTTAINLLFDTLTGPGVKVHDSYRTSIHVHLNFAIESYRTIYNFMCLSFILDELLVSQNGDHRIGNNFCLRVKDAMGQMNSVINSIQNGHGVFGTGQNERYSSINFASLGKFGSIEFRSLECTTHKGRLMHWINTLQSIKVAAREFDNPTEIISLFSQMGPKEFLIKILGPYALKYIAVPDVENMLRTGMRIAQDFAYCASWKPVVKNEDGVAVAKGKKKLIKHYDLEGYYGPNNPPINNWNIDQAIPANPNNPMYNLGAPQPVQVEPEEDFWAEPAAHDNDF